jgi:sigma-E factor negative regulatory protein RseC
MAQTMGYVTAIGKDGQATVVAEKGQGCSSCGAASQCHGGRAAGKIKTQALNQARAAVGDRVSLTVASGAILSRMAVLYLVPVLGMITGAFVGEFTTGQSVVFALAGFALGFIFSITISRAWSSARPVIPVITRVHKTRSVSALTQVPARCDGKGVG